MTTRDDGKKSRGHEKTAPKAQGRARGTVSELARHIEELGREVHHLKKAARREVEDLWAVHHSDLYPRFLRWQEALGIESFAVFSLAGNVLKSEPLLSSANAPDVGESVSLGSDSAKLASVWGGSALDLVLFALASRDCQVDFRSGVVCVPIAFFENPRGVVLARAEALTPSGYGALVQQSNSLLAHVREVALSAQADSQNSGHTSSQTGARPKRSSRPAS